IVPAERVGAGPPPARERQGQQPRDDDEDSPRPARRRPPQPAGGGGSTLLVVLLLVGFFVVVLMVGGGLLLWWLLADAGPPPVAKRPPPGAAKKDGWGKKDFDVKDKFGDKIKDDRFFDKGFPKFEEKKEKPKRPAFGDNVAQRIALDKGGFEIRTQIGEADPFDRDTNFPAKLFLVNLLAGQAYVLEVIDGGAELTCRLESLGGKAVPPAGGGRRPGLGGQKRLYGVH